VLPAKNVDAKIIIEKKTNIQLILRIFG